MLSRIAAGGAAPTVLNVETQSDARRMPARLRIEDRTVTR